MVITSPFGTKQTSEYVLLMHVLLEEHRVVGYQ